MSISIGPVTLEDPVILAPMSGVTDLPFRRMVKARGAGLVVSEMIASQAAIRETLLARKKEKGIQPQVHEITRLVPGDQYCLQFNSMEAAYADGAAALLDVRPSDDEGPDHGNEN